MLDNSLGMAVTMAMHANAMRVGGTYLKVSIVQGGMGEDASRLPFKYFLVSTHCCTNT